MLLLHYLTQAMQNRNQLAHSAHNVEEVEVKLQLLLKIRILSINYLLQVLMTHYCVFQVEVNFTG